MEINGETKAKVIQAVNEALDERGVGTTMGLALLKGQLIEILIGALIKIGVEALPLLQDALRKIIDKILGKEQPKLPPEPIIPVPEVPESPEDPISSPEMI